MNNNLDTYLKNREVFLQRLVDKLSSSEQFVAAWLSGSFATESQDALSDIDITLVVSDEYAQKLCVRPKMVSAQTNQERYALFSLFGQPAFIHENNHNAPEGGTFTFVAYKQSAVMVDWVLRPLSGAQRPENARMLFEKVNIPVQSPGKQVSQEQRADEASEMMAFFWMMAAITVKYIYRNDDIFVNSWLEELANLVIEVERRVQGRAWQYKRGSSGKLRITTGEQISAIRQLCHRMETLRPKVTELGGYVAESPMTTIETLISVVQEKAGMQ